MGGVAGGSPGVLQAEGGDGTRQSARSAPPEAAPSAFLSSQQGLPHQGVVLEAGMLPGAMLRAAMLPGAVSAPEQPAAASAPAGAAQKRRLEMQPPGGVQPPSPFSSPNLRFLAGFLDAPGLPPAQGAPQPWSHAERGREEGKLPAAAPAKLQRGANTAKTISRFDRLSSSR